MSEQNQQKQDFKKTCINCGRKLVRHKGVLICLQCNPDKLEYTGILADKNDDDYVFIDCPGATLYQPGTNNVVAGAKFTDENGVDQSVTIIKEPVYAPTHTKRRRIKREAQGKIRRCQGCQDYTVRMRRPEGPDFFIPSAKHPGRKKLKSVQHISYEP